ILDRTDFDTKPATGTVIGRDLEREKLVLSAGPAGGRGTKPRRRTAKILRRRDLAADHGVGAYEYALAALDANLLVPNWQFQGDFTLFMARRSEREGAIGRHLRH